MKAILFDKDGTLMDFHSIWVKVAEEVVAELIRTYKLPTTLQTTLLKEIGVEEMFVNPHSVLAAGTSMDLAYIFCQYVPSISAPEMREWISEKLFSFMYVQRAHMKMTADLPKLLTKLREQGYILGVVTADDYEPTQLFLQQYQLQSFFEFIVTSDTFPAQKPNKQIVDAFCDRFQLHPSEVVIVGDTPTDMHLAQNSGAGYAIGVLSGTGDQETLAPLADILLPSVGELISDSGKLVWNETEKFIENR